MTDPVIVERHTLIDMTNFIRILCEILLDRHKKIPLTDEENSRIIYANKCMEEAIASYSKSNK